MDPSNNINKEAIDLMHFANETAETSISSLLSIASMRKNGIKLLVSEFQLGLSNLKDAIWPDSVSSLTVKKLQNKMKI